MSEKETSTDVEENWEEEDLNKKTRSTASAQHYGYPVDKIGDANVKDDIETLEIEEELWNEKGVKGCLRKSFIYLIRFVCTMLYYIIRSMIVVYTVVLAYTRTLVENKDLFFSLNNALSVGVLLTFITEFVHLFTVKMTEHSNSMDTDKRVAVRCIVLSKDRIHMCLCLEMFIFTILLISLGVMVAAIQDETDNVYFRSISKALLDQNKTDHLFDG